MGKFGTCRGCGAEIMFMRTVNGKTMPVDKESVYFVPDVNGKNLYVIPDGTACQVIRGCEAMDADPDKHIGFISHFATCPKADDFRKKKPRKSERKKAGP